MSTEQMRHGSSYSTERTAAADRQLALDLGHVRDLVRPSRRGRHSWRGACFPRRSCVPPSSRGLSEIHLGHQGLALALRALHLRARLRSSPPPEPRSSTQATEPTGVADVRSFGSSTTARSGRGSSEPTSGPTMASSPANLRSTRRTAQARTASVPGPCHAASRRSHATRCSLWTTNATVGDSVVGLACSAHQEHPLDGRSPRRTPLPYAATPPLPFGWRGRSLCRILQLAPEGA
jgi:hypothetical protein